MPSSGMDKKKTKKQNKDTLAEVAKEMAKPRVAKSAREQLYVLRNDLIVKDN
jgi:hypothetical protein